MSQPRRWLPAYTPVVAIILIIVVCGGLYWWLSPATPEKADAPSPKAVAPKAVIQSNATPVEVVKEVPKVDPQLEETRKQNQLLTELLKDKATETKKADEHYTLHPSVVKGLMPKVNDLIQASDCWKLDWAGRQQARNDYGALLEVGKKIDVGYDRDHVFRGVVTFDLHNVKEPIDQRVVQVTVDVNKESVLCDVNNDFAFDWKGIQEEQKSPHNY